MLLDFAIVGFYVRRSEAELRSIGKEKKESFKGRDSLMLLNCAQIQSLC